MRADLRGGRRPSRQAWDYRALDEHGFSRLRLLPNENKFGRCGVKKESVIDRLVTQVADRAACFRQVVVRMPDGSHCCGENQGHDRDRDQSPSD